MYDEKTSETRSTFEVTARKKLYDFKEKFENTEHVWDEAIAVEFIVRTFVVMYSASLTVEQIEKIGSALTMMEISIRPEDMQKMLTKMIRAKVLRKRKSQGRTLYEVILEG